jgi:hypothetical protein
MAQLRGLAPLTFSTLQEPPLLYRNRTPSFYVYLFPAFKHNPAASTRTPQGTILSQPNISETPSGVSGALVNLTSLWAFYNHPTRWSLHSFPLFYTSTWYVGVRIRVCWKSLKGNFIPPMKLEKRPKIYKNGMVKIYKKRNGRNI